MLSHEADYLRSILCGMQDAIIVEAGAYDGENTEFILSCLPTPPRVYLAFEADPRNIGRCRSRGIDKKVTLVEAAISDHAGHATMWLSHTEGGVTGSSSLRDPQAHREIFPDIRHDEIATVVTLTLDDVFRKYALPCIDFLFTDIEGSERDLVAGGAFALARTRYWYTEFWEGKLPYAGMWSKTDLLLHLPEWRVQKCFDYDMLLYNAGHAM